MSTRKFLSLFLPSKPKVISSPTPDTTHRVKKARNETDDIGAINSVLTDPLIRNAFLKSFINRGDQKSAIFILMMQQFKKSYDGLSQVKAYSIYDISIRIKESDESKNSTHASTPQAQLGSKGTSYTSIPSYLQIQSEDGPSYDSFLSNIAISKEQSVQIARYLQDGRIKNAFDGAYATVCAQLLHKKTVKDFINQIVSESRSFTPQGKSESYISQLASNLETVGFDTRAMGLYL
ncbi:hypothetical protein K2X14_17170 [Acetobacter sp. TBRC 12305]|uniref:Uncharacterized protein n=1 Tax=Acetobacter garciniae TaxID=2817435 RepID=A0A939HR87_9PROT|nr:hypothetical protein [Acetobacter garciniae]MBO1326823.1 hypothetical protein [Acetobacter garciniae]MBX0346551.1 hypothetical protein [Acetobacter garciniae]